jgi:hypothetical protein
VAGTDGERLEIRAGVTPGERVVVTPPPELKDGSKVKVKG